jgi:hypothetical protein
MNLEREPKSKVGMGWRILWKKCQASSKDSELWKCGLLSVIEGVEETQEATITPGVKIDWMIVSPSNMHNVLSQNCDMNGLCIIGRWARHPSWDTGYHGWKPLACTSKSPVWANRCYPPFDDETGVVLVIISRGIHRKSSEKNQKIFGLILLLESIHYRSSSNLRQKYAKLI